MYYISMYKLIFFSNIYLKDDERKVKSMIVNYSINVNKMNNHLSS
jgi:hypothetical protein